MTINLLPRKRSRVDRRLQTMMIAVAIIMVPLVVMVLINFILQGKNDEIRLRVEAYQEEAQSFAQMNQQSKTAQALQTDLKDTVALLRTWNGVTEHAVCFTKVLHHQRAVIMEGKTRSVVDLAALIKQWSRGTLFAAISIDKLTQPTSMRAQEFRVRAKNK